MEAFKFPLSNKIARACLQMDKQKHIRTTCRTEERGWKESSKRGGKLGDRKIEIRTEKVIQFQPVAVGWFSLLYDKERTWGEHFLVFVGTANYIPS